MSQEENIEYLSKTRSLVEASGISMGIAEYMLRTPNVVDSYVKKVHNGARFLRKELTELEIRWHGSYVTNGMLVFLTDNAAVKDCVNFLKSHKIYVRDNFPPPYDRCFRVTIGPTDAMEKFVSSFRDWYFSV